MSLRARATARSFTRYDAMCQVCDVAGPWRLVRDAPTRGSSNAIVIVTTRGAGDSERMTDTGAKTSGHGPAAAGLGAAITLDALAGRPYDLLAHLRAVEPVAWLPVLGGWLEHAVARWPGA